MPLAPLVRLNKKMFTRHSCAVRIGPVRITEVDSIEWSDEVPYELVDAMNDGGAPTGKARGKYACEASLSVYADAASYVEAAILAQGLAGGVGSLGGDLSASTFQLLVSMTEDVRSRSVLIANCNIVGRPSRTVGNDGNAIVMQYKLQPTYIVEDGKSLVSLLPAL